MKITLIIFGGHILSGLGFLCLLLPFSKKFSNRHILSIACLMTALGIPYMYIFDLAYSNHYLFAALPALVSLVFFMIYFSRFIHIRPIAYGQSIIASVFFVSAVWGNLIIVYFTNHCAFGACV